MRRLKKQKWRKPFTVDIATSLLKNDVNLLIKVTMHLEEAYRLEMTVIVMKITTTLMIQFINHTAGKYLPLQKLELVYQSKRSFRITSWEFLHILLANTTRKTKILKI